MVASIVTSPILLCCSACFAATALLSRYAWPICKPLGLIDIPDARKRHSSATALLGGVALIAVILPLALIATWLSPESSSISLLNGAIATAVIALIGIFDDRHSLNPHLRVALSFALFSALAVFDRSFLVRQLVFPLAGVQFGLYYEWLAIFFTSLCCVGLINAVNMADGKNGLVLGLCIGWLLIIFVRSPAEDLPFIAVMISGLVALLVMNLRGRLFLGDGGAYGISGAIGLLTIRSYTSYLYDPHFGLSAEVVVILFIVPVLDSFRLTATRIARGQSPFLGDRNHFHHHLQNRFGWPNGLYIYLFLALIPGALATGFLL